MKIVEAVKTAKAVKTVKAVKTLKSVKTLKPVKIVKPVKTAKAVKTKGDGRRTRRDISPKKLPSLRVATISAARHSDVRPPWRQSRGKLIVSLVNSPTNATRIGWHPWEIELRFAPELPPG